MTVRVPQRLIWQLDKQIEAQRKRVAAAEVHLAELIAAREGLMPLGDSPSSSNGKSRGGHARAETLSPDKRSEIAKRAATKRWSKVRGKD